MRNALLFAVLLLASLPAFATDVKQNTDAKTILSQQSEIRTEALGRKGRYKDMDESQRTALFQHQDTVNRLLQGVDNTADLAPDQRMTVFNALEAVEAIVNKAEDERMVCEKTKPIGSHRPERVCKTVAQRREERLKAEQNMQRDQRCVDAWGTNACSN